MNKEELVELLAKSQDAILERIDSKLQELKRSISEDQEECLSSFVKRVKDDNFIKWKKVGNETQFKFNQSVEARFDSAISAIEKKKLDRAKKELEEVLSTAALSVSTSRISAQISVQETNLLRLIPFFDLPENFVIPNRSSAFKFKDFVNEAISELIERGCVKKVLIPPKFTNPLHVVQQSGGKCRLILDLSRLCRSDLDSAGFFVNLQKSVWEPSQVGTWLGFHLDFSLNFITVPLPKITKLQESISRILALRFVNAKDLASVAGQLNSMFLAIGNIVRLMSRAMYAQISAQNSWFSNFYLEDSVVEELVFWQSNLDHLNGRRIWFKSSAVRVAFSDASDTGYGGYIIELGPRFWNLYCEAMDTFTRSWDFENNWVCPPPDLVPRTLRHMRSCCAQGTLIAPLWRSAPFWPLLTTVGSVWLILLTIGWTCPS
ncbi:unnamed protein product [Porites lobata]|uniref:Reverse transcriptase n=1 Tax=Porites lobata TaxID=104759 RepID=A0ABN8R3X4_9CNID|nr:unnamed protein product [Porites lobata]